MRNKYTIVKSDAILTYDGRTLYRIKAKVAIISLGIAAGTRGGYVESEKNLDHSGDAWVSGDAQVSGNARVSGDARVSGMNITAVRSDGYTFTVAPTPEGARIIAGCRYFTFDEARLHWTKTRVGTSLGDESLALVDHLERMAVIRGFLEPVSDPE